MKIISKGPSKIHNNCRKRIVLFDDNSVSVEINVGGKAAYVGFIPFDSREDAIKGFWARNNNQKGK